MAEALSKVTGTLVSHDQEVQKAWLRPSNNPALDETYTHVHYIGVVSILENHSQYIYLTTGVSQTSITTRDQSGEHLSRG